MEKSFTGGCDNLHNPTKSLISWAPEAGLHHTHVQKVEKERMELWLELNFNEKHLVRA